MEGDKRDLERQVNELKAKCDAIEKREAERRAVEEKKHAEEIQFLKRTNQQLKVLNQLILRGSIGYLDLDLLKKHSHTKQRILTRSSVTSETFN